jgi:glycosyltransferase involved in cell wall biosynthesis
VVQSFADRLPIKPVFEPVAGLSSARNAAIDNAAGDYVVWTDDDVTVDRHWLTAYYSAFVRRADVAFFGGKIVPQFEGGIRPWVRAAWPLVKDAFAERDLGPEERSLPTHKNEFPYGANYAVRMVEQRQYRYDPTKGNSQNTLSGGEETAVMARIASEGGHGYWVPDSRVYHRIEAARQSKSFLAQYFRSRGAHAARNSSALTLTCGCPRWLYRQWFLAEIRYRWLSLTGSPERWVQALRDVSRVRGSLDFCRGKAHRPRD